MISDVLCEAISEIDRYLTWDTYQDENGIPDPEIVRVRNEMKMLLIDLDYPGSLLSGSEEIKEVREIKEWKRQTFDKLKRGELA